MLNKTEQDEEDTRTVLEEINMDDLEDTAFLRGSINQRVRGKNKLLLIRFVLRKIGLLVEVAGIFKVVIILGSTFIFALALIAYISSEDNTLPEFLPSGSIKLAHDLVEQLKNSAIPLHVLTYAPIVILDRKEKYFPSDLRSHIRNTHPTYNFTPISNTPSPLNLSNLDQLNSFRNGDVYLSSQESIVRLPKWLTGQKPNKKTLQTKRAFNCVIVVVEKDPVISDEDGQELTVIDAFYLYFYSFNDGPRGLGHQLGNHIGDWEHNMIRFTNGTPTAIWYSQHGFGAAYTYEAVQKIGSRPVVFSARGSHSNWPEAMAHDFHTINNRIPSHIAYDYTSLGYLWDPTLSALFYSYKPTNKSSDGSLPFSTRTTSSPTNGTFTPALTSFPTGFLYFNGYWGDQQLRLEDESQEEIRGFYKWANGPKGIGWGDKQMMRETVCPNILESDGNPSAEKNSENAKVKECIIRHSL